MHNTSYNFEFLQVEKPYESYTGANVRLRYVINLTLVLNGLLAFSNIYIQWNLTCLDTCL